MTAPAPVEASAQTATTRSVADLAAAAGLAVLAALLAVSLPGGNSLRALVTLPVVLVVPGYLLIEASVGSKTLQQRGTHALVGLGASPPLVGLLALCTAIVPGGFHAGAIIGLVTVACLLLAAVAGLRRLRTPNAAPAAATA